MSLISTRIALTHLVTTQRDQSISDDPDAWGQPADPDWQDYLTGLPCYGWTDTDNSASDEEATVKDVRVRQDRRMLVVLGTDITELDRVGDITDQAGNVLLEGPMGVQAVLPYPTHLEVCLRRIR